jgi:hypothetical protein
MCVCVDVCMCGWVAVELWVGGTLFAVQLLVLVSRLFV